MKLSSTKHAIISPFAWLMGFNKPLSDLINQNPNTKILEDLNVVKIEGYFKSDQLWVKYGNDFVFIKVDDNAFVKAINCLKRTRSGRWKIYIYWASKEIYTPTEIINGYQHAIELIIAGINKDRQLKQKQQKINQEATRAWKEFEK